jgi:hypothetical protein
MHRGELAVFDYLPVIGPRELLLIAQPKRGRFAVALGGPGYSFTAIKYLFRYA